MDADKLQINYNLLAEAMDFYKNKNYTYFHASWMVKPEYSMYTTPSLSYAFRTFDKDENELHLVGSAEQSFIQEVFSGNLEIERKFVSVSPCFRLQDNGTPYHQETFMKVELSYYTENETDLTYLEFGNDAMELFNKLNPDNTFNFTEELNYKDGMDINGIDKSNNNIIEIGSYGVRCVLINDKKVYLHYGTGIALPRFQFTL